MNIKFNKSKKMLYVSLLLFTITIVMGINNYIYLSNSHVTDGEVVEILKVFDDDDGDYEYWPVIEFITSKGEPVEFKVNIGSYKDERHVGEIVSVLYNPLDIENAKINIFINLWAEVIFLAVLMSLFLYFGLGISLNLELIKKIKKYLNKPISIKK